MTTHDELGPLADATTDFCDRTAALDRAQRRLDFDLRALATTIFFPGTWPTPSSRPGARRRRAAPTRAAASGGGAATPSGPAAP